MRALLVVNPNATATTAAGRDVIASALRSRLTLRVVHTDHRGHAADLTADATADGVDLVVVHGGDGTINEVVNGLLGPAGGSFDPAAGGRFDPAAGGRFDTAASRPALAVVPGGSANVFARALGVSPDPLEAAQQLMAAVSDGTVRRIGLGRADERWFLFNAGLGWDAEVVHAVEQRRNRGKDATPGRYFRAAVRHFLRSRRWQPRLTVELPHAEPRTGMHMVLVSGSDPWTYLGGRAVHTNPTTTVDGGLGVFGLSSLGAVTVSRVVTQMLSRAGNPHARKLLRVDDVPWVTVRSSEPAGLQLDGDYLGVRDAVTFSRVPSSMAVLAPPRS